MNHVITNNQIKLIHVAKRQLGLEDGTYRGILERFGGVRSSAGLNPSAFERVMEHFGACGFERRPGASKDTGFAKHLRRWEKLGRRPGMATAEQLARIEADWDGMRFYWAKDGFGNRELALRGFLKKRCGVSDLRFLSFDQAHKLIEALKAIRARRKR